MAEDDPGVFEPGFLSRLERLAIVARKTLRGVGLGERRSKRAGGTVEFADYRGYSPGDDTRQIDWYAYARLEQLFLKLYLEEQDLSVHVLLDQSASMATGQPSKLRFARQLALALTYVALSAGDRANLSVFRGGAPGPVLGPLRGRRGLVRAIEHLARDPAGQGPTALTAMARGFVARRPAPGVVILLSDFLDPAGYQDALERLRYSGYEPHAIQVVAPEEAEPEIGQDLDLVDSETGRVATVALDQQAVASYRLAFASFQRGLADFCRRHEMGYLQARTDLPVEEVVLQGLRRGALVR